VTAARVSVVITTFNTGRYLPETLASVFAQSYQNVEVIVVDDGSTDDSVERARDHASRLILVERAHEGLGPARNAGLERATGDYIAFLDSDDLWDHDTLSTQVDVALRHPASGLVVSDGVQFEGDRVISSRLFPDEIAARVDAAPDGELSMPLYRELLRGNLICCPAQALIPRAVVETIGAVSDVPVGAQDYDYYVRIAKRFPVTLHRASLARWRFRPDSMSGDLGTRGLHLAALALCLLEHEALVCAPEDRAAVDAAITRTARHACAEAARARLEYGVTPDPTHIATVYRLRPRDPVVIWTRAAFGLPAPLDRSVLAATRGARRTVRALGRESR
jgi:hypothetical protein